MSSEAILIVLVLICGILAVGLAAAVYLWQKVKAEPAAARAELEQMRQSERLVRESFETRLQEKDSACQRALDEKELACRKLIEAKEQACAQALSEKAAACARQIADKEQYFGQTVATLKEQFANLAAQTLKAQSGDLTRNNAVQLEGILKPLREQVEILRSATEKTQSEHAKLAEAIGKDVGRISDVARELTTVSDALTANPGFQGRKGEEILAEKLRQAGLEEGVNFFLQTGTSTDRPDAQVCDPANRWLIIDSKVVLTSYFQLVEAQDEETRKTLTAEHVARVREKIDQLAKKKYPMVFADEHKDRNYLPVTAMFMPYEEPLQLALREDASLWKFAADNNVVLVTPLTLQAYLRLVYLAWQHEKESRNQLEIVNTARELLTRMNAFLTTFEGLGKSLSDVQSKYLEAKGVLVDAPHAQTIAKSANKLIDLHVRLESRKGKRIERAACLQEIEEEAPAE